MASHVHVVLVEPGRDRQDHVGRRLRELERAWSRFIPNSDISRLIASPDSWVKVSPDTLLLLESMKRGWRLTHRRYDPTMLAAIVAAGYSGSVDAPHRTSATSAPSGGGRTIEDVALDEATCTARVPQGLGVDAGGIGKGLAADIVVEELLDDGVAGALVCIGGDLAAGGVAPSSEGWYVRVEDPFAPSRAVAGFAFSGGGIATSSTVSRAWLKKGRPTHHVLDPATSASSTTDLATVTAVADTGWEAEVHATAALVSGSEAAWEYLDDHGVLGVLATAGGVTAMSRTLSPSPG